MIIEHGINAKLMALELDTATGDIKKQKSLYTELYTRLATIKGTNLRNKNDGTMLRLTPNELMDVELITSLLHECALSWQDLVKSGRIAHVEMIPVSYENGQFDFLARATDTEDSETLELSWSI